MIRNLKIKGKIIIGLSMFVFVGIILGGAFCLFQIVIKNVPLITPKTEIRHLDTLNVSMPTDRAKNYYNLIRDHEKSN